MECENIRDVKIYPNPAYSPDIYIEYTLLCNCTFQIDIHDINGKFEMNLLSSGTALSPGKQKINLNFKNRLNSGVYLITLKTNKGDVVVRKIIIN